MVEYSNSYLRLKLLNLMKDHGIRGEKNGFTKNLPKKQKYRAVKVEHAKREVIKIKQNRYKKTENVEFLSQNLRDLPKNRENDNLFSSVPLSKIWGTF